MTKIITIEEHYQLPHKETMTAAQQKATKGNNPTQIDELTMDFDKKIAYMDKYGISMQVLSNSGPNGAMIPDKAQAVAACQHTNDTLAAKISKYPGRFGGFAVLPMTDPEAAAEELERTVNQLGFQGAMIAGLPFGHYLDEPQYRPIFAEAEKLNVPLYLHPGMPTKADRERFQSPSYDDRVANILSMAGWGWHEEAGVQMVRLICSGLFDQYPNLHLISGHWGEMVPNFLERLDLMTGVAKVNLDRKFSDYYKSNVYVTPSGMFTKPQFALTLAEVGPSHIIWSEDFPYVLAKDQVAGFLNDSILDDAAKEQIGHRNAEQLLRLN